MKEYKKMQSGGMLLEMIAVLGLVAVSAPAIYKKNIERTEEIRDMTKASQLRVLKDAASQYVEKQYDTLIRDAYKDDSDWKSGGSDDKAEKVVKKIKDPKTELANYLPEGYEVDPGIEIYLTAKKDVTEEGKKNRPRGLVSAIVIDNEEVTENRGNRIARMVGVEGGYTMDNQIYGNRGAWSLTPSALGVTTIPENRVAVSSTYSKNLSSSDYIYRNKVEGYPEANMMFTDIDMNGNSIDHIGRLAMRYNNGDKWAEPKYTGDEEGSTGGAERDKGLSLLVHGERGEIVGKTRSVAKDKPYEWWEKARDEARDDKGELKVDVTNSKLTHFEGGTTLELSVGGPTKVAAGEPDGYLRMRATNNDGTANYACTRIESNYNMPDRGGVSGLTGGGAFIACANYEDNLTYTKPNDLNGGDMGLPTASLVADDKPTGAAGSGYMIVTNPGNKRKAVIYGNYATSFFNNYHEDYAGSAMEAVNKNDKVVALAAASLKSGISTVTGEKITGAKNGLAHDVEGSVTNLYDQEGNVKMQFRADDEGGFIYAYGNNGTGPYASKPDYADKPTVAVKGALDPAKDGNESYALVTQRQNRGYAIMQSNYKEDTTDPATGAFMIKDEKTKREVAVMGNKEKNMKNDTVAGGYFALKDGETQDRFRAVGGQKGGAVYMGNGKNATRLNGDAGNENQTVMIEAYHADAKSPEGGYMRLSNTKKAALEVASNKLYAGGNDAEEKGGGMFASKDNGVVTAKIHSSTKGDFIGADFGGGVALRDGASNARQADLVTSSNISQPESHQGGTFALRNGGSSRNVLVTARGPRNGGWMSVSKDDTKGVDFYGTLNKGQGGQINVSDTKVTMVSGRFGGKSPLMTVSGGSDTKIYGAMTHSDGAGNGSGGGFTVGSNVFTANDGTAGALIIGGSQGVFGSDGRLDVGGVKITNGGALSATGDVNASARIKAKGGLTFDGVLVAAVVSAKKYNNSGEFGTISEFFKDVIHGSGDSSKNHMGTYATANTGIGHDICDLPHKECPNYLTDEDGKYIEAPDGYTPQYGGFKLDETTPFLGPDSDKTWGLAEGKSTLAGFVGTRQGRMHDYGLYSYGKSTALKKSYKMPLSGGDWDHMADARHSLEYDLQHNPKNWPLATDNANGNGTEDFVKSSYKTHLLGEKWHDNITDNTMDDGPWSKTSPAAEDIGTGSIPSDVMALTQSPNPYAPDAVPLIWTAYDDDL